MFWLLHPLDSGHSYGGEDGKTPLVLSDFASADLLGTTYASWLPAKEVVPPIPACDLPSHGGKVAPGVIRFTWRRMANLMLRLRKIFRRFLVRLSHFSLSFFFVICLRHLLDRNLGGYKSLFGGFFVPRGGSVFVTVDSVAGFKAFPDEILCFR